MTPLAFTQDLIVDLARSYPQLPSPTHAQLGDLVVDCAGLYGTVLNLTEFAVGGGINCGFITLADITVVSARDCANVSNDDGTTNWTVQNVVSVAMDADSTVLWEWAEKARVDSFAPTTPPSVTFLITGGVSMVMLNVQLPVP